MTIDWRTTAKDPLKKKPTSTSQADEKRTHLTCTSPCTAPLKSAPKPENEETDHAPH